MGREFSELPLSYFSLSRRPPHLPQSNFLPKKPTVRIQNLCFPNIAIATKHFLALNYRLSLGIIFLTLHY